MSFPKSVPENLAAVNLLIARLTKVGPNEQVTYSELSGIARLNITNQRHRYLLYRARDICMAQHGIAFAPVTGVGLTRLDDCGLSQESDRDRKAIRRKAVRGKRKTECVQNLAAMPQDKRTRLLVNSTCFALIEHASRAKTGKKLEQKIQQTQAKLPIAETLAALS